MSGNNPFADTEKLIRCSVTNKYKEQSIRHIELNNFRLWEHLMISKHGATINDVFLCLWVTGDEFTRNENIYSRAGNLDKVNRIVVDLFDEEYGFSNTITRFVRSNESDQVLDIILSHVPDHRNTEELCQVRVDDGLCIEQVRHNPDRPMFLGLDQ